MAPVVIQLEADGRFDVTVAVTAQHREMLDQVLRVFRIEPRHDLGIMREGQSLSDITTRAIRGLREVLRAEGPDLVLVHGDTTTALCAGLVGFYEKIPVGHVEAGLRTRRKYDPFPEEMNRRLIGVLADLHFAPLATHRRNLIDEGVIPDAIFVTGNTVIDALLDVSSRNLPPSPGALPVHLVDMLEGGSGRRMLLVTAHRRESFGAPIRDVCKGIARVCRERPDVVVVFPAHRNPQVRQAVEEVLAGAPGVVLIEPVDYVTMVYLMKRSYLVLTDSGGLQEEAPSLGKPVLVLRETTERPEGVAAGTLRLVGRDPGRIASETLSLLDDSAAYRRMAEAPNPYGDGRASRRVVLAAAYSLGLEADRPADYAGFGDR